jgi:hypothetical protein
MFLTISYQRLFSRSLILSRYPLNISSLSSHSNVQRHRTSSSPPHHHPHRINSNNQTNTLRRLFQPIDVKPVVPTDKLGSISSKDINTNIGQELTGGKILDRSKRTIILKRNFVAFLKDALLRIITDFYRRDEIKKLAADQGLDIHLFQDAYVSFRKFCIQSTVLPVDLHIVLSDIISESGIIVHFFFFC